MEDLLTSLPAPTDRPNNWSTTREITLLYGAVVAVLVVFFGVFTTYEEERWTFLAERIPGFTEMRQSANISVGVHNPSASETHKFVAAGGMQSFPDSQKFADFQGVHIFVFLGFGFMTSYLTHGVLTATGHSMAVATFAGFFAILCRGFFAHTNDGTPLLSPLVLNIGALVEADYAAAACLISFGAVMGRVTIPQLLAMAFCEVIFFCFNEGQLNALGVADVGGALAVHSFAAIFGLAVSMISGAGREQSEKYNTANDFTTGLSMVGSLLMFVYFPAFNAAAATSHLSRTRAIVNTYVAVTCSCLATFFIELYLRGKIEAKKIQRATLAGGIAIAGVANMTFTPFRAAIAGFASAALAHYGADVVAPLMQKHAAIVDTCGVMQVHGLNGLLGGLLALFGSAFATLSNYQNDANELGAVFVKMGPGAKRPRSAQVIAQLVGLVMTIVTALVGGLLTGLVLRGIPDPVAPYHDGDTYDRDSVPDCPLTAEQQKRIAKRKMRAVRDEKLAAARQAARDAFERKDAEASKEAHKIELELEAMGIFSKKRLAENKAVAKAARAERAAARARRREAGEEGVSSDSASSSSSSSSSDSGSDSGSDSDNDWIVHAEPHSEVGGDTTKTIVFGALDGIMTTYAIVTAAAGGNQDWRVVLGFGFANLLSDAFAMGWGDYIGSKAEIDKAKAEREREDWENTENPEGEIREMINIYKDRGFPEEDARDLVMIHAKDHNRFVDFMMKEELQIDVDVDDEWGPVQGAFVMFFSFLVFGCFSLLPYLSQRGRGIDSVFIASSALVGFGLLFLGAIKGRLSGMPIAQTAVSMLVSGILSGGISYVVGNVVTTMLLSGQDVGDAKYGG